MMILLDVIQSVSAVRWWTFRLQSTIAGTGGIGMTMSEFQTIETLHTKRQFEYWHLLLISSLAVHEAQQLC